MKKKLTTIVAGICALALLGGCAGGAISNDNIKIKKYKGLEIEKVELPVTDEDVEQSIRSTLETTEIEVKDRSVQQGDIVYADYEGKVEGTVLEDWGGKERRILIGDGEVDSALEQAIIGHNVGDTFEVTIPIPEECVGKFEYGEFSEKDMVIVTVKINQIKEGFCKVYDVTDRVAKLGDIATIDFVGKKDGVAFDGGAGTDYKLELGSKQFIDGFEDGVVGHNIGETFDLDLKFPDDYGSEDLAGQAVVFTVTLKGLEEKIFPELTADILEKLGTEAKTIEEYKAQIRSDLEVSNKETAESTLLASVWEALVEQCEVKKFPKGMLDEYVKNLEEQYSYYAQMYGMEIEEFFKQIFGMSSEEVAKTTATQELAINLIAEKEGLTISDKAYEEGLKELASQYGYEDTEEFVKAYTEDGIRKALLQEKVGKFLVDNAVQVEPKEDKEK